MKIVGKVITVILICVLLFCCLPDRDDTIADIIDIITYKEIEFTEPTKEQMLSDFDYMLDVLKKGIPNISEAEKLYGFDEILVTKASATISGHCGAGTVGVLDIYE